MKQFLRLYYTIACFALAALALATFTATASAQPTVPEPAFDTFDGASDDSSAESSAPPEALAGDETAAAQPAPTDVFGLTFNDAVSAESRPQIRQAIADELALPLESIVPLEEELWEQPEIRVALEDDAIVVTYRDREDGERTRSVKAPARQERANEIIAWLVGNLVRNQTDAFQAARSRAIVERYTFEIEREEEVLGAAVEQETEEAQQPAPPRAQKTPHKKAVRKLSPPASAGHSRSGPYFGVNIGAELGDSQLGGRVAFDGGYRFGFLLVGAELGLSAGTLTDVEVVTERQITEPSVETNFESVAYSSVALPVYLAMRLDFGKVGLQLGAGPGFRLSALDVGRASGTVIEGIYHAHAELSVQITPVMRLLLRPYLNYGMGSHRLRNYEERHITAPQIVDIKTEEIHLIQAGLAAGVKWEY